MKKAFFAISILLLMVISANAQNVCPVDKESQADVKLFVVSNLKLADLCVYDVSNASLADRDNGKWHFVCCENDAQKKVYFVDNVKQADLKVYFVSNESQAGWKNRTKDYLMK